MDRRVVLPAILGIHLLVAVGHGTTHVFVPVVLTSAQQIFVLGTTFLGPIVGVALAHRGHRLGVPLFTVSMIGALLVGGLLHFVFQTPDHVQAIPAGQWRVPFQVTAVAVALTPAVGTVIGAWYWRLENSAKTR